MHGVIWLPLNWTFSIVPPIESTRGFNVSSIRSVSSMLSKLNFTYNDQQCNNLSQMISKVRLSKCGFKTTEVSDVQVVCV